MAHPCLSCGACCATWAVQLERSELTRALRPHVVPAASSRYVILAGTEGDHPRCAALQGEVGQRCRCGIYDHRPSPCHEVQASLQRGRQDSCCDEARVRHGLAKLRFDDWR